MGKKSAIKKTKQKEKSATEKGKLVEEIVATLHEAEGIQVKRNVRIPSKGKKARKREIDVLLMGEFGGYPIQRPIECKNEAKPIGSPKIDAFIGKLEHIGFPSQNSVYVSVNGYTSGAIERAVDAGIRPLILTGVTEDGFSRNRVEVFQHKICLLLEVIAIRVTNGLSSMTDATQISSFFNVDGKLCGTIYDLIWQKWVDGGPPSIIGEYNMELEAPSEWHHIINGKVEPWHSLSASVRVLGLVTTIPGEASQHELINAINNQSEKNQIDAKFDLSRPQYNVTTFRTEQELAEFQGKSQAIQLMIGRFRLPRINIGSCYWPPSERAIKTMATLMQAFDEGKIPDPRPMSVTEIEGLDIGAIWDPIWPAHPSANKN